MHGVNSKENIAQGSVYQVPCRLLDILTGIGCLRLHGVFFGKSTDLVAGEVG